MWGFKKSEKMDILQKTQENLEATQKNTDMLISAFKQHIESNNNQIIVTKDDNSKSTEILLKVHENLDSMQKNNMLMTETLSKHIEDMSSISSDVSVPTKAITNAEKIKAAYALNLCTVSVSQIIDYNDMQILESEYEAILNNLNLEHFPKDDALLEILKHLLDVITFFRIQEGDKKIMEEEYTRRMKNAIWSAVPNIGMVATGGSPVGIAVSLACQIGIGYMNYRKEKAKIGLEKQRSEWELQRSAIEQFNGLRRELFDTAWRLSDEYDFPDKYRLTERQINQYNIILMDTDDMRRYERLQYISDNFIAYPPFWYYLGHAANSIYVSKKYGDINYNYYKEKAIEYFDKFFKLTDEDLLRENQLVASCALEKFDLIDNKSEKIKLIEKAQKASGNAFDALELCAISYLKMNEIDKACDLLRMLVNEEYNVQINAQLLSRIYVQRSINEKDEQKRIEYHNDYMILDSRVSGAKILFPMLEGVASIEVMEERFLENRKEELKKAYGYAMAAFIEKCEDEYIRIYKIQGNIVMAMAEYMSDIKESLKLLIGDVAEEIFLSGINNFMVNNGEGFQDVLNGNRKEYDITISFENVFDVIFKRVANNVITNINSLTQMGNITYMESNLYSFKKRQNIQDKNDETRKFELSAIEKILLGEKSDEKIEIMKKAAKCLSIMNETALDDIIKKENKYVLTKRNSIEFKKYFDRKYVEKLVNNAGDIIPSEDSIVAVLQKNAINVATAVASNVTSIGQVYVDYRLISDADLVFTTEGIAIATNFSAGKNHCKYSDVNMVEDKIIIDSYKYKQNDIDNESLYRMIGKLKEVSYEVEKNLATKIKESIQTGCPIETESIEGIVQVLSN